MLKRFHAIPLTRKLTLLFALVVLLPCMLLGAALYQQDFDRRISEVIAQNESMMRSMVMDIRIRAAQVEIVVEQLVYDVNVQRMLQAQSLEKQILLLFNTVSQQVRNSEIYLQHLAADIVIISPQEPFAERFETAVQETRMFHDPSFQALRRGADPTGWGMPGKLIPDVIHDTETFVPYYQEVVLGLSRRLGTVKCGVAGRRLFAALSAWEEPLSLLVHRQGVPVYRVGMAIDQVPQFNMERFCIQGGVLYLSTPLEGMDYDLLVALDYGLLHSQSLLASIPAMLVGLLVGCMLMLATRLLLKSLLGRLQKTMHAIGEMHAEHAHARLPCGGTDEVGQLVDAFNCLLERIEQSTEDVLRKEQDKQQARLMALQYQINPHFLFNALYWLQMKTEEERMSPELSNAIASLGVILRYNLSDNSHATLEQEIVHMRAYIAFMRIRHSQNIDLALSCPAHLHRSQILRFTFQPILENAIHHGLIPGRALRITVDIAHDPQANLLRVDVANDGQCMDPEERTRVQELLARVASEAPPSEHGIGLSNLVQRLGLYYGAHARLMLAADEKTTRFVVLLPLMDGKVEEWK